MVTVSAWHPAVPGITEVFHADFTDHAYPLHTHDTWTLLIVDDGAIRFDLDRHEHGAVAATVTLLPPHVPHDGRSATAYGFRKRVLYLDATVLNGQLAGSAVGQPSFADRLLRQRIHQLHRSLEHPSDALEAESRLALIRSRLHHHLQRGVSDDEDPSSPRLAAQLRDLLDSRITTGITLKEAAGILHSDAAFQTACWRQPCPLCANTSPVPIWNVISGLVRHMGEAL